MKYQKENLDFVLVPGGLVVMFGYHLWLLYRCLNCPQTTVIGFENNDKKAWVDKIMKMDKNAISIPLSVLSSNISTSTYLSSICLTLCALLGAWVTNSSMVFQSELIYGDIRSSTISIKYICLLVCFLLAFACFIESTRSLIHATYLISMPDSNVPTTSVESAVIRGGDFWSLGLRALYLALLLLIWLLGPIPMFATSITMVCVLYFLDNNTVPLHLHQNYVSTKSMGSTEVEPTSGQSLIGGGIVIENV
ncbi:hypothetical protein L6452_19870 [Arctium lappa]|uniref:Uncharacterized protein n=1 Tax=Arctium lappa TaxID=4217 RepID=A0ACB9B9D1_ARCLA|nr:hypothetical protein L6452_19870 [Arctium lappa]